MAGFSGAIIALVGANAESMLGAVDRPARVVMGLSMLAGTVLLIFAFVFALRAALLPHLVSGLSSEEVANYLSERFTSEPDLWRVHIRMIRGLLKSIKWTIRQGDRAARSVAQAAYFFLVGLAAVGLSLVILVLVVTF